MILSFLLLISMLYLAINQPKFFVSYFLVKYIYRLLWLEIIAILSFAALSLLSLSLYYHCYLMIALFVILSISEISLYCFLSIWGSIFYQQILLGKNIKRHCVK